MDAMSLNSHRETYEIDGGFYTAIAYFSSDKLVIEYDNTQARFKLSEYDNFEGNMKDFITEKVYKDVRADLIANSEGSSRKIKREQWRKDLE